MHWIAALIGSCCFVAHHIIEILINTLIIECDCNLSGGEYLLHQFVWGQRFTRKYFDNTSDAFWLPDMLMPISAWPAPERICSVYGSMASLRQIRDDKQYVPAIHRSQDVVIEVLPGDRESGELFFYIRAPRYPAVVERAGPEPSTVNKRTMHHEQKQGDEPLALAFSDWYDAKTGRYRHFIARSVQGGVFAPMLRML